MEKSQKHEDFLCLMYNAFDFEVKTKPAKTIFRHDSWLNAMPPSSFWQKLLRYPLKISLYNLRLDILIVFSESGHKIKHNEVLYFISID